MTRPTDDGPGGLTPDEFDAVRRRLYAETGISLGDGKADMVRARLARRVRDAGAGSVGDYLARLDADPAERQAFVNALTTNKTDFFRESHHFDYLRDAAVPAWAGRRRVRVWSAGCSTGEEPYTLALTLREHCPGADGWDVRILASDVDTAVLAAAERGVYAADRVADVPAPVLRAGFLRGTGANAGKVAVRPEVRDLIAFRQINLVADRWPVRGPFDAIFCRNVVIYFDRPTQTRLLGRFADLLRPGGLLFMGHSENLHGLTDRFAPVGRTVYRLRGGTDTPAPAPARRLVLAAPTPPAPAPPAPDPVAEPEHTIILGDVKATGGPAVLKTLLGSCVSACVFDPVAGVGGMNHFSLPGVSDAGACARYGAHAMELLVTAVMKLGGDRARMRAKVFGGARVLNVRSEQLNVGAKNAAFVLEFLREEGIPVDGQCLGGDRGILVRFRPHTGQAQARPLAGRDLPGVVRAEDRYERELTARARGPAADGGVTMF